MKPNVETDLFRLLADQAFDGLLLIEGEKIIAANETAAILLGNETEKLLQNRLIDFLGRNTRDIARKNLAGKKKTTFDSYSTNEEGQTILLEVTIIPVKVEDQLRKIVVLHDVSRRKRMERALLRSEAEYKKLFEDSKDAIYISSRSGRILDVNEAAVLLFGYSKKELLSLDVHELYANPEDRTLFQIEIETYGAVRDYELHLRRKDNSVIECLLSSSIRRNSHGEVVGYQGIIRDITALKKAQQFKKDKELAEQSVQIKQQFLANISHEIRTPLNAIFGMTNLLDQTTLKNQQKEYLSIIRNSTDHLLVLINDILDFSKIEAGKIQFDKGSFDLRKLLDNLRQTLQFKLEQKDLEFQVIVDPVIPQMIVGDAVRLNQILINLLTNAIKFTDEGHILLEVKALDATSRKLTLAFSVEDTGIGIPSLQVNRIFESFAQLDTSRTKKSEGTGLGLAITRKLIDMQGGSISVKSEEGKGSVFSFILKFDRGEEQPEKASRLFMDHSLKGEPRILVAEDNRVNQIVIQETLKKWDQGIKLETVENGCEAIELLRQKDFDLIIMDVQMPEMNGHEATRYIRQSMNEDKCRIPILAMTAYATTGEADACLKAGMDDYISKPFDPDKLFLKIRKLLKNNLKKDRFADSDTPGTVSKEQKSGKTSSLQSKLEGEAVVDLNYLKILAQGDKKVMRTMVQSLIDEMPGDLNNIQSMINEKNWEKVGALAHKFKSTGTFVGNKELEADIKLLEQMAKKEKNEAEIRALFMTIRDYCHQACEELREIIHNNLDF